jgi:hypothetical protein
VSASTTWSFDGTQVDALLGALPARQPGERWTAELLFSNVGAGTGYKTRYSTVREFVKYADRADYGRTLDGTAWYREELPAGAPISSLAVPVEPETVDSAGVFEGIWGLVVGGDDPNQLADRLRLDVELVVLANRSEYSDRTALETALADSGLVS